MGAKIEKKDLYYRLSSGRNFAVGPRRDYAPYAVSSNGTGWHEPDIEKILEQGIEREAIETELMNTAGLLPDDAIGGGSRKRISVLSRRKRKKRRC